MKSKENEKLYNLRHSAAHLLAQAVVELYPGTKLTLGPVTEHGFFYDFQPTKNFKEEDLPAIEKKMHEIAKKDLKIVGKEISKDEAKKLFADNPFKLEMIENIEDEKVGIFSQGDFFDLCKGGHLNSTKDIKHFKLTAVSGSYWRADKKNAPLQRISGIAFESKADMDAYFKMVEESKLYDHRKLGKELDLFSFHQEAPGSPFYHEKGLRVYNKLIDYSRKKHKKDYQEVKTPLVMSEALWKVSGHYDNYKENMYFTTVDEDVNCIRPMNCPGGILIYKERPHSYRELPLRMMEYGSVYRYELSGVLHGLFRVRTFTIDDAHIFCSKEQIEKEVIGVVKLASEMYKKFGFEKVKMGVSTRPQKAMGSKELWDVATNALKKAMEAQGIDYQIQEGDGAFYGPKIDMVVEDAMGREWQCGTVQLDFFLPQNFKLEYVASDQSKETPVIIHRALYGSIQRLFGILLEHHKGRLPFWLAPVQVSVLTITDDQNTYGQKICDVLSDAGIEVELDDASDKISAKIRRAQMQKIPWMLVIGKKELEKNVVTLRHSDGKQEFDLKLEDVVERAKELSKY